MARITIDFPQNRVFFRYQQALRITDLNYGNHLAHDTLISLLHEARSRMFIAHQHREGDIDGVGILVADLAVSYQAEVFYPDVLEIEIAVGDLSRKGGDLVYRVIRASDKTVVALAKTGIVFFDFEQRQAVAVPAAFNAMIASVTDPN